MGSISLSTPASSSFEDVGGFVTRPTPQFYGQVQFDTESLFVKKTASMAVYLNFISALHGAEMEPTLP